MAFNPLGFIELEVDIFADWDDILFVVDVPAAEEVDWCCGCGC